MKVVPGDLRFGISEPKPLRGFPEGRARIRQRPDDFTVVTIRTATGVRQFYVEERDGAWWPFIERGRNDTVVEA